jgi:hypothetical protein
MVVVESGSQCVDKKKFDFDSIFDRIIELEL